MKFWRENASSEPREIIDRLLESCGRKVKEGGDEGWWLLFEYVADEYHRLNILLRQGHYRDVIMGSRGLAELVVDSLFFLPWFRAACRVEKVKLPEPRDESERVKFQKLDQETGGLGDSLIAFFEGKPVDPHFFHLDYDAKIDLLLHGRAKFKVWAKRGSDSRKSPWKWAEDEDERTIHGDPAASPKPPAWEWVGDGERDVEISLKVAIGAPGTDAASFAPRPMINRSKPRQDRPGDIWKEAVGFPRSPGDEWEKARNAMTHLRSPLNPKMPALCQRIMGTPEAARPRLRRGLRR